VLVVLIGAFFVMGIMLDVTDSGLVILGSGIGTAVFLNSIVKNWNGLKRDIPEHNETVPSATEKTSIENDSVFRTSAS